MNQRSRGILTFPKFLHFVGVLFDKNEITHFVVAVFRFGDRLICMLCTNFVWFYSFFLSHWHCLLRIIVWLIKVINNHWNNEVRSFYTVQVGLSYNGAPKKKMLFESHQMSNTTSSECDHNQIKNKSSKIEWAWIKCVVFAERAFNNWLFQRKWRRLQVCSKYYNATLSNIVYPTYSVPLLIFMLFTISCATQCVHCSRFHPVMPSKIKK